MAFIELRAAAQQLLEALRHVVRQAQENLVPTIHYGPVHDAMNRLEAALAEPQEPDSPERRCGGPGCDGTCCQPVQESVAFITPLMEQQMFDDWCPYKGSPDPRTVWAAAVDSVNGLLLGASAQPAQAEPVQEPVAFSVGRTLHWHEGKGVSDAQLFAAPPQRPAEPVQEPVAGRAAFERHAKRLGYSVDPDTREGREGGYWSSHTQLMWLTWQAAMAQRSAQPAQETEMRRCPRCWEPMFPPHRAPLTEEEIMQCFDEAVADYVDVSDAEMVDFARAIERAHGIKE